jgi:hypothetical protein
MDYAKSLVERRLHLDLRTVFPGAEAPWVNPYLEVPHENCRFRFEMHSESEIESFELSGPDKPPIEFLNDGLEETGLEFDDEEVWAATKACFFVWFEDKKSKHLPIITRLHAMTKLIPGSHVVVRPSLPWPPGKVEERPDPLILLFGFSSIDREFLQLARVAFASELKGIYLTMKDVEATCVPLYPTDRSAGERQLVHNMWTTPTHALSPVLLLNSAASSNLKRIVSLHPIKVQSRDIHVRLKIKRPKKDCEAITLDLYDEGDVCLHGYVQKHPDALRLFQQTIDALSGLFEYKGVFDSRRWQPGSTPEPNDADGWDEVDKNWHHWHSKLNPTKEGSQNPLTDPSVDRAMLGLRNWAGYSRGVSWVAWPCLHLEWPLILMPNKDNEPHRE